MRYLSLAAWCFIALVSLLAETAPTQAQLACSNQTQSTLLPQFSDNAPPNSITPANARNIICSKGGLTDNNTWTGINTFTGTLQANVSVAQAATHNFTPPQNAIIDRFNDRIFVAGATAYTTGATDTQSWLGALSTIGVSSTIGSFAQAFILSDATNSAAANALVVGNESINVPSVGQTTISLFPIVVNNNTTLATTAWAIYAENHRINSTVGFSETAEFEMRNLGNTQRVDPYTGTGPLTNTLGLGCGAGQPAAGQSNCSLAINIAANPKQFTVGITVNNGSIAADPNSGLPAFVELPATYAIEWYTASNTVGTTLSSDVNNVLQVSTSLNVAGQYKAGGIAGVTKTCTVNQALTLIFTSGILTGGTCNS